MAGAKEDHRRRRYRTVYSSDEELEEIRQMLSEDLNDERLNPGPGWRERRPRTPEGPEILRARASERKIELTELSLKFYNRFNNTSYELVEDEHYHMNFC
ncbi:unnamed protein product [Cuscuta epithymum]|uniref:Uncharacterized protein n=1 Tax=Cuscuta epithymum TaxID=186058 RepID=A0AAV0F6S5_9ASTE|nr:unnamed protein product [Cuscuta epithymum]CAH9131206.1 unnamed protein product [Cuscuta epithymum]